MQSIVSDGLSQLMYFIQLSSTNTGKKLPSFVDCGAVLDFMLALVSVANLPDYIRESGKGQIVWLPLPLKQENKIQCTYPQMNNK
jgi:hypothetical protein